MKEFSQDIVCQLQEGNIGVIPTDTLYGLVGSALNRDAVERVYAVRARDVDKPCIVLIADSEDFAVFGAHVSESEKKYLQQWWPGKVSVIIPVLGDKWTYLHRGTHAIAFRIPQDIALRKLLQQTGPLIAPSANMHGMKPAETIEEARQYFATAVDVYVDGGLMQSEPSTLVCFENNQPKILRQGAVLVQ